MASPNPRSPPLRATADSSASAAAAMTKRPWRSCCSRRSEPRRSGGVRGRAVPRGDGGRASGSGIKGVAHHPRRPRHLFSVGYDRRLTH